MKLDRNLNLDGGGKYALVNMRKLRATEDGAVLAAMETLTKAGIIHYGASDGGPGEQFFVMKYKDKFTARALLGYHEAILETLAVCVNPDMMASLKEYAAEIREEYFIAAVHGTKTPD